MASNNGVFPELTIELGPSTTRSSSTTTASPLGQTVENALREVLAWRPRSSDAKGFVAALNQAFKGNEVDGHMEFVWQPRSYAVQADMGEVTGAQASIHARARHALEHTVPLLEGLTPLRADADEEDSEAARSLVISQLTELVNELGQPGGPRLDRVDGLFSMLLGDGDYDDNPEVVDGLFGLLRDRLGLARDHVNNVPEEQNLTNLLIGIDHTLALRRSWTTVRRFFDREGSDVFLGTQLVLFSRAFNTVADSVQELYFVFDSLFLGAAERQTVKLRLGNRQITIAELFSWVERFVTEEAPQIIRDAGKDGVIAFRPTVIKLKELVDAAVALSGQPNNGAQAGFHHPRARTALLEVANHMNEVLTLTSQIQRQPPPTLTEVRLFDLLNADGQGNRRLWIPPDESNALSVNDRSKLRLVITGENFQEGATVEAYQRDSTMSAPVGVTDGSVSFMDTRFILAFFDLNKLGNNGLWHVAVINPDEQRAQMTEVFRLDTTGGQQPPSPPPNVTRLDPPSGNQGQPTSVVIHGKGFQAPVVSNFGAGIMVIDTGLVTAEKLRAFIKIDDHASPGPRTVTVQNGDLQQVAIPNGFKVEPARRKPVTVKQIELRNRNDQLIATWTSGARERRLEAKKADQVAAIRVTFSDAVEPTSIRTPVNNDDAAKASFLVGYERGDHREIVIGKITDTPQQPEVVRFEATGEKFVRGFPVGEYKVMLYGKQTTGQNAIMKAKDGTPIDGDDNGSAGGNFSFIVQIVEG